MVVDNRTVEMAEHVWQLRESAEVACCLKPDSDEKDVWSEHIAEAPVDMLAERSVEELADERAVVE